MTVAAMTRDLPLTAVRLRQRMEELGWTQEALAEAVGSTQGAISLILTGKSQKSRLLPHIAGKLSVNLNWLLGVVDEKIDMFDADGEHISEETLAAIRAGIIENRLQQPAQLNVGGTSVAQIADELGLVPLREIDLAYGMGATFLDVPITDNIQHFPAQWLRQYSNAPADKLFFARGAGDSMFPTLLDSDTLLIDTSVQTLTMSDQVWALAYCGLGMIKRLRPSKDGGLRLLSDNPNVPEEVAYDGEAHLIGRVAGVMRKM